ncbi:MAG: glycoside hydrolase family 88 protein [Prevotellaceae bacterium]|jgi:predicted alpha-1,6-mannanase (GH76 family)|nr:glycoside hydrolase family 88 protein [Prevotellaceae bacterium]
MYNINKLTDIKAKVNFFSGLRLSGLGILTVAGLLLSCAKATDDNVEPTVDPAIEVKAVEQLIAPADGKTFELAKNMPPVKFEWEKAEANKKVALAYEIFFFAENGTPSEPIHKLPATTNSASITLSVLSEIATKAGIEVGDSGIVKWTVRAYYGSVSALSTAVNTIVIKRPEAETPVTKLFLTGSGTEFGEDISESMPFVKNTGTEFTVFSRLTAGLPFKFVSDREGDKIRSFSVKNNKLVEDGTDATIAKTGVYKIRVNIASASVEMKEITDISLFYCVKYRYIPLQYEGRGKWKTVCLINFSREGWGEENRYKFRMIEGTVNKFLEKVSEGSSAMKEAVISNPENLGDQLWSGIWGYSSNLKDRWAEVVVDMYGNTHSIKPVAEDFGATGTSWADIANRSTSDFVKGFWNYGAKHFYNSLSRTVNQYDYWPEAHAIDVIIDAYTRTGDNQYKQIISDFHDGVKKKNGNTFKNSYYDDMAWHGLAHLRAFEATDDPRYEESARDLWDWILTGWDENGGGIKWNDQQGSTPGVPSTGPSTIIGVRRWVKYGDTEITDGQNNLEWAKKMYEWMRKERHDPATGGVYDDFDKKDGAWTYNTGTFLGSAMELYDVTKEQHYLEDAIRTADWTLENLSVPTVNNRILSDWAEQEDHDVNLFKGIFIRYFTRLIMHHDLPADKRDKYVKFIVYNAKALLAYASATVDREILIYNYGWYFKPKNSFLRGQTSGCMLMEALALLEKEGFLGV